MWFKKKRIQTGGSVRGVGTGDGAGGTGTDDGAEGIGTKDAGGTAMAALLTVVLVPGPSNNGDEVLVPAVAMEVLAF